MATSSPDAISWSFNAAGAPDRLRVIAQRASTDSNYLSQFGLGGTFAPLASYRLLAQAKRAADARGQRTHVGNVLSSDVLYHADTDAMAPWRKMGVLAVEMESAGLYANAAAAGVDALALFTVSDRLLAHEQTTSAERQTAFGAIIEIALELASALPPRKLIAHPMWPTHAVPVLLFLFVLALVIDSGFKFLSPRMAHDLGCR